MTWTTPHVFVTSEITTATSLNGLGNDLLLLNNSTQMFGVGAAIVNTPPVLGVPQFLVQAGTVGPITTNSSGGQSFSWPQVFPTGLLTVGLWPGDSNVPCTSVVPTDASTNQGGTNFIAYNGSTPCNTVAIRVNFVCWGW
jgi:hypothetical protein